MQYSIICPWKIESRSYAKTAVDIYTERIDKFIPINLLYSSKIFTNEADSTSFLLSKLQKCSDSGALIVALDERGEMYSSESFSRTLSKAEEDCKKMICFCVGGAFGLPKELEVLPNLKMLSLSKMTFPHELSLVLLLEQIYRARTIMVNHPYHHGKPSGLSARNKL